MLQTALAMRTTTLRLGTAVIVLPWHNPVLLAEQAATLDLISGGRLDFGIGKGYRHNEFAGFRIPMEEAEPRFEESIEVMTKAFVSRERFSHRGKFWQFDDIVVEPPPSQRPHPPFWIAAASEASIRRAAQRGFNLILDQYASPEAARPADRALPRRAAWRAARRSTRCRLRPPARLYVAKDKAEAEAALRAAAAIYQAHRGRVALRPTARPARMFCPTRRRRRAPRRMRLYGTPDEICESSKRPKAGVEYILLTMHGGLSSCAASPARSCRTFAANPAQPAPER